MSCVKYQVTRLSFQSHIQRFSFQPKLARVKLVIKAEPGKGN